MKAIITDLDRTLLHTDKTISEETIRVLKECKKNGMVVVVATARPERAITMYQEQVGFDAIITLNGARTVLESKVLNNSIPKEFVMKMVKKIEDIEGTVISLETDQGIYSNVDIPLWNPIVVGKLSEASLPDVFYKVLISDDEVDLNQYMEDIVDESTYYTVAEGSLFQIMDKKATKWNGICDMLDSFGISPRDAIYFGDDNDDIEAIKKCGIGVAVSNAIDEVKAVADYVTKSNDEDGVAAFILSEIKLDGKL